MKPPMLQGRSDDFQTPGVALQPLLPFLKKEWTIWECAEGKGNLSQSLWGHGFAVVGSDILPGDFPGTSSFNTQTKKSYEHFTECNFLTWQPERFDCIITNPPFSLKDEFIERAYQLGKPFAFLLPLTTFEGRKRQKLFAEHGVEVLFFNKRINFQTPSGKDGGSWFMTAWFTHGLNIGKQINFVKLEVK